MTLQEEELKNVCSKQKFGTVFDRKAKQIFKNEQKKFFMKMCKKAHYFSGGMNCTTNIHILE